MQRTGVRVCANIVAYSECVWTMAPQSKARYSSRCVGASEDGRRSLSTTRPLSSDDRDHVLRRQLIVGHAAWLDHEQATRPIDRGEVPEGPHYEPASGELHVRLIDVLAQRANLTGQLVTRSRTASRRFISVPRSALAALTPPNVSCSSRYIPYSSM